MSKGCLLNPSPDGRRDCNGYPAQISSGYKCIVSPHPLHDVTVPKYSRDKALARLPPRHAFSSTLANQDRIIHGNWYHVHLCGDFSRCGGAVIDRTLRQAADYHCLHRAWRGSRAVWAGRCVRYGTGLRRRPRGHHPASCSCSAST